MKVQALSFQYSVHKLAFELDGLFQQTKHYFSKQMHYTLMLGIFR